MVRRHSRDRQTPDLFEIPEPAPLAEGSLNFAIELRGLLSQALKDCPHSRWQVAARMSELLGAEVTRYQLDAWTAESREPWRFPVEYLFAFEVACDTTVVTEWIVRHRGGLANAAKDDDIAR